MKIQLNQLRMLMKIAAKLGVNEQEIDDAITVRSLKKGYAEKKKRSIW